MNYKRCFFFLGNIILIFFIAVLFKFSIIENCLGEVLTDTSAFLSLVLVQNDGAAFNLFSGFKDLLIFFAVIIILACTIYVLRFRFYISDSFLLQISMFCAGIFGNAYERYMFGYVTDYIKLNLLNFPVFNIYDVFIVAGALSIAFVIIKDKRQELQEIRDAEEDELYSEF